MVDNIGPNKINSAPDQRVLQLGYPTYAPPAATSGSGDVDVDDHLLIIREQERLLPIANVGRIMKRVLPANAKISKEGKETMQECVSEFISFVTGEASDKCHKEKRKTVNGDDICWALGSLGFDEYCESLKRYLIRYREVEGERANQNKTTGGSGGGGERDQERMDGGDEMGAGVSAAPFGFDLMDKIRRI